LIKKGHSHLSLGDVKQFAFQTRSDLKSREHVIELVFKHADKSQVDKCNYSFSIYVYILERLDQVFHRTDTNNDKLISFDEFKHGHELIHNQFDVASLQQEFNSLDTDHSGTIKFDI